MINQMFEYLSALIEIIFIPLYLCSVRTYGHKYFSIIFIYANSAMQVVFCYVFVF